MNLANLILSRFRGRADVIAVGAGSAFQPELAPKGLQADRLERDHLGGVRCLGFYLLDESAKCWCSCVDFDNKPDKPDPLWKAKAEQFYYALLQLQLSPIVEISQSGNAAHVWLFFPEPTDAWVPRSFWRAVAAKLDVKVPEIYPRQDQHVGKGFGNLVRYPLWQQSSFVDVEDAWKIIDPIDALGTIQTVSATDLKMVAFQAGLGELKPDPRVEIAPLDVAGGCVLPVRVQRLVSESNTLLGKRWRNDAVGMADKSRSAVAMSLVCELVRAYVPTPEIASALRAWCTEHGYEEKGDRDDWINRTVAKAYDYIVQRRETKSVSATTFHGSGHAYIDLIENNARVYVPSGIRELDESIDGVAPGEVCIIAGRPSHGKTAVALQWLGSAAQLGVNGLLISEEMGMIEIGKRRLQTATSIPQDQWVAASAHTLRKDLDDYHKGSADVYVVESCGTIDRCEEVIDQFCQLYNVGLVAVDYLQLLGARTKDRYEVVTECSRRIKQAARRNNVAILLLSQLNRGVENRDDNEPKMSDLRESGQIEQDADLILFAQYPCRFDANMPPDLYRLWGAKRRNGPIRSPRMELNFDPHRQIIGLPPMPAGVMDL